MWTDLIDSLLNMQYVFILTLVIALFLCCVFSKHSFDIKQRSLKLSVDLSGPHLDTGTSNYIPNPILKNHT